MEREINYLAESMLIGREAAGFRASGVGGEKTQIYQRHGYRTGFLCTDNLFNNNRLKAAKVSYLQMHDFFKLFAKKIYLVFICMKIYATQSTVMSLTHGAKA